MHVSTLSPHIVIKYKEFYNKERGTPEPKWGPLTSKICPGHQIQCSWCNSHEMYASASSDDPEEIFPHETVRCGHCGHITDWYEARKQYENHYTSRPLEVVR